MTDSIDFDALLREAYRLGYEDRARERDYDPGHALDLLTHVIPPGDGDAPVWHEPPPGWVSFGTLVDYDGPTECSEEVGLDGLPLWERPIPPGEQ